MRKLLLSLLCLITLGTFAVSAQSTTLANGGQTVDGYESASLLMDFTKMTGVIEDGADFSTGVSGISFFSKGFSRETTSGPLVGYNDGNSIAITAGTYASGAAKINLPIASATVNIASVTGVSKIAIQYSTSSSFPNRASTKTIDLEVKTGIQEVNFGFNYTEKEGDVYYDLIEEGGYTTYFVRLQVSFSDGSDDEQIELNSFAVNYYKKKADVIVDSAFKFDKTAAEVTLGATPTGLPVLSKAEGAPNAVYSTSDATIATVTNSGAITAKAVGTCTITARTNGNNNYTASSASYTLTVKPAAGSIVSTITASDFKAETTAGSYKFKDDNADYEFYGSSANNNFVFYSRGAAETSLVVNSHPNRQITAITVQYASGATMELVKSSKPLKPSGTLRNNTFLKSFTSTAEAYTLPEAADYIAIYPEGSTSTSIKAVYVTYKEVPTVLTAPIVVDADSTVMADGSALNEGQVYYILNTTPAADAKFVGTIGTDSYNEALTTVLNNEALSFVADDSQLKDGKFVIEGSVSADYFPTISNYKISFDIALPVTEMPEFSVAPGTYPLTQSVEITCGTENASIYYTTDGTDPLDAEGKPTANAVLYKDDPIEISATTTIKAAAIADKHTASKVATAKYIIEVTATGRLNFANHSTLYIATSTTKEDTIDKATFSYTETTVAPANFGLTGTQTRGVNGVQFVSVNGNASIAFSQATLSTSRLAVSGNSTITVQAYRAKGSAVYDNPNYFTKVVLKGSQVRGITVESAVKAETTVTRYEKGEIPGYDGDDKVAEGGAGHAQGGIVKSVTTTETPVSGITVDYGTENGTPTATITLPEGGASKMVLNVASLNYLSGVDIDNVTTTTGVNEIYVSEDLDAPVEYYNLQGLRLNGDNLPAGIVIKKQGSKVTKLLVH